MDQKPAETSGGTGLDPKVSSLLAYLLGIVGGIVFYAISKDSYTKFHGMQSILVRRRHPWVLWKSGFLMIIILAIVVLSFLIWGASRNSVIVLIAGVILIACYIIARLFVYNNDLFIITNQRIINIDQGGFFARVVSEAELINIQNVSYEIRGPMKSLMNFGKIIVQTAGNAPGLVLENVENPHFVQEKIVSLQNKISTNYEVRRKII